jgi:hypothetical protein
VSFVGIESILLALGLLLLGLATWLVFGKR